MSLTIRIVWKKIIYEHYVYDVPGAWKRGIVFPVVVECCRRVAVVVGSCRSAAVVGLCPPASVVAALVWSVAVRRFRRHRFPFGWIRHCFRSAGTTSVAVPEAMLSISALVRPSWIRGLCRVATRPDGTVAVRSGGIPVPTNRRFRGCGAALIWRTRVGLDVDAVSGRTSSPPSGTRRLRSETRPMNIEYDPWREF